MIEKISKFFRKFAFSKIDVKFSKNAYSGIINFYLENKSHDQSSEQLMLGDLSFDSSIKKSSEVMISTSNDKEVSIRELQFRENLKGRN